MLTIAAWTTLIYYFRDAAKIVMGDVAFPILALAKMHPKEWLELVYDLRYFFLTAAAVMAWVVIWAVKRRRQLRQIARVKSPTHLPVAQHAARFGLKPETLEAWHEAKVTVINFDQAGHIISDEPPSGPATQQTPAS